MSLYRGEQYRTWYVASPFVLSGGQLPMSKLWKQPPNEQTQHHSASYKWNKHALLSLLSSNIHLVFRFDSPQNSHIPSNIKFSMSPSNLVPESVKKQSRPVASVRLPI